MERVRRTRTLAGAVLAFALAGAATAEAREIVIRRSTRLPIVLDLIHPFASRALVLSHVTVDPIVGVGITGVIPPWHLENRGTVYGNFFGHDAVYLTGGSVLNAASGRLDGAGDGVQIDGFLGASVENHGWIRGRGGAGVFLPSGGAVTNAAGATIEGDVAGVRTCCGGLHLTNRGAIRGDTGVLPGADAWIHNLGAGARITGTDGPGIEATGGWLHLHNEGTVEGTGSDFGVVASSGYVENAPGGVVRGGGGGILGLGSLTVLNRGRIEGPFSVSFGGGSNTLVLDTGSELVGTATGGGGDDTVLLYGTGSEDDDFSGFEHLRMRGDEWTLSGSSSFGDLVQSSGLLNVEGTLDATTTIEGGTLALTGMMPGDTTVGPGGRLVGTGTTGNLSNSGTVQPGFSIGTLTVNGAYVQQAGSVLAVEVDDAGAADRIAVNGTATLNGGTVVVMPDAGRYAQTVTYTLVTATGGVAGTYDALVEELPFVDGVLGYGANSVTLSAFRNANEFDTVARCPNQIRVANALDAAENDARATADMRLALEALIGSANAATARQYLDEVGAPGRPDVSYVNLEQLRSFQEAVTARADVLRLAPGLPPASFASSGESAALGRDVAAGDPLGVQGWLRGIGLIGDRRSGDCAGDGYRYELGGGAFGLDAPLGEELALGAALASGYGNARIDGLDDTARAWHVHGALYGAWVPGLERDLRVTSALTLGWIRNDTARSIGVQGFSRQALGDLDSFALSYALEASAIAATVGGVALRPQAGLQLLYLSEGSMQERNAGALDLDLAGRNVESLRTVLGLEAARRFALGGAWSLDAGADAAWSHELLSLDDGVQARFAGSPASGFEIVGDAPDRDRAILGAGLVLARGERLFLSARYLASLSGDETSHAIQGGIRLQW